MSFVTVVLVILEYCIVNFLKITFTLWLDLFHRRFEQIYLSFSGTTKMLIGKFMVTVPITSMVHIILHVSDKE